jgi:ubiquitin carboxyl-terminal hydrolase 4/11/15
LLIQLQARSEDVIRRKILEKVATFTTDPTFVEDEDTDASTTESIDPDIVLANGSDSSGDSKVVANSIDGEEGLVDVTMKESVDTHETGHDKTSRSPESIP